MGFHHDGAWVSTEPMQCVIENAHDESDHLLVRRSASDPLVVLSQQLGAAVSRPAARPAPARRPVTHSDITRPAEEEV